MSNFRGTDRGLNNFLSSFTIYDLLICSSACRIQTVTDLCVCVFYEVAVAGSSPTVKGKSKRAFLARRGEMGGRLQLLRIVRLS